MVDLDTYKYWQDKFYMYTMLKNKNYIPTTYIILNRWIYRNKPTNDELFSLKNVIQIVPKEIIYLIKFQM